MTILEIMERANTRDTKLVTAWIKDALHAISSTQIDSLKVDKQSIVKDKRNYLNPFDSVSIMSVSIKDTEDSDKYKSIRRLVDEPLVTERKTS